MNHCGTCGAFVIRRGPCHTCELNKKVTPFSTVNNVIEFTIGDPVIVPKGEPAVVYEIQKKKKKIEDRKLLKNFQYEKCCTSREVKEKIDLLKGIFSRLTPLHKKMTSSHLVGTSQVITKVKFELIDPQSKLVFLVEPTDVAVNCRIQSNFLRSKKILRIPKSFFSEEFIEALDNTYYNSGDDLRGSITAYCYLNLQDDIKQGDERIWSLISDLTGSESFLSEIQTSVENLFRPRIQKSLASIIGSLEPESVHRLVDEMYVKSVLDC